MARIGSGLRQHATVIKPMLSTLVKEPFTNDDYIYEVKWDGYRIIAFCLNGTVKLQSRGGQDYTKKYPGIVRALKDLSTDCIIDGEVVFINSKGKPDFDALQKVNGGRAPLLYYVFDLLWINDNDITSQTLLERKVLLKELVKGNDLIKYSDDFDDGILLFENIKRLGLEGIVAKQKQSKYIQDDRSKKWLKVTTENKQEFVIGGWVESKKRKGSFRTLLFGAYENGKLKWKGHAGGGYKESDMPKILDRLKEIETTKNPFDSDVEYGEGKPHWVKPELVANIKFATTTKSGKIRKPAIFLGFREDKTPNQVTTESAKTAPSSRILKPTKNLPQKKSETSLPTSLDSNWPELERQEIKLQDGIIVDGCPVTLYNVERQLWKGVTKADLIEYYNNVSKFILPHISNRPLSLHVKHKGPHAPGLYIKDMEGRQPRCADIFSTPRKHKKSGKRDVIDYIVCNNRATLLYLINLGCIDINPWTSTVKNPLHPDFIVIDLDPSDGDFKKAIETARAAKELFDRYKLKCFVKTSGKTGLHIFIPCQGFDFAQARVIAEKLCDQINALVPDITTTTVTVSDRGNKLYIDPNQNDYADTVASAYSVRPFTHPYVSTPLEWREVKIELDPAQFTIESILNRLEKKGDAFENLYDPKIKNANCNILRRM